MMSFFLSLLGFMSVEELKRTHSDPERTKEISSSVVLAAKGLSDQTRSCHLAGTILRLLRGSMNPSQAHLLRESDVTKESEADSFLMLEHVRSSLLLNIVSSADDAEKLRVNNLIRDIMDVKLDSDDEKGGTE